VTVAREDQTMQLKVIIHPDEEGGYWAEVPGFPGCVSEGDTLEEVRANIRDAFEGVLAVLQDRGAAVPAEQAPGDLAEVLEL
jgi:predicted RNase H-like HicB family nuclease